MPIPYVDIFAGPGGLGEGFARFASFKGNRDGFSAKLSIEKDATAAQTLTLRSFFHQFLKDGAPAKYYDAVRDPEKFEALKTLKEWHVAENIVWRAELGQVPEHELHTKVTSALRGRKKWVLLGGPPCQAYSLVGRSRMTGIGWIKHENEKTKEELSKIEREKKRKFYADHRHKLYREYLRIVAVHQPAVFVMENVKGILSAKIPDKLNNGRFLNIFPQIRDDLADPWRALEHDPLHSELESYHEGEKRKYRLYSFTEPSLIGDEGLSDRDFLIRAEKHGVPQSRHRVILLGVREDIRRVPGLLTPSLEVTVRDVLESLAPLRSGLSRNEDSPLSWQSALAENFPPSLLNELKRSGIAGRIRSIIERRSTNYTRGAAFEARTIPRIQGAANLQRWIVDRRLGGTLQHETRAHMNSDLGRYLYAAAMAERTGFTPKLSEWPESLLPAHRNVTVNNEGVIKASGFHDRFRVQSWGRPSTTITSHISKDGHYYIHPDPEQCRSLTVREAARLQTFPDNYYFCGNRTEQYHQVGNAVPPYLAVQLAEIVAELLK